MAIIDELITKIRFDFDDKGLQKMQSLEGITNGVSKNAAKMGGAFETSEKGMGKALKSSDKLAASFKRVALSALGAVTAGAMMKFTLNVADDSKQLKDMSDSLDLNASELRIWGSAMKNAGRDAGAFYNDLKKQQQEYGHVSFGEVMDNASELQRIFERTGKMGEAISQGSAWGWSEESVKFLVRGPVAIQEALDDARKKGQDLIAGGKEVSRVYGELVQQL